MSTNIKETLEILEMCEYDLRESLNYIDMDFDEAEESLINPKSFFIDAATNSINKTNELLQSINNQPEFSKQINTIIKLKNQLEQKL